MTMQRLECEFGRTGDSPRVHGLLGISLSTATPESQLEIKRFSAKQKEALKNLGFVIYGLTGQSIETLRDNGRRFWLEWHRRHPDFEALGAMRSEVAINPSKLFLPKSGGKTLYNQERMVGKLSRELGNRVTGVKAIIGQAPDYVELAFRHLDSTREYLFGVKYGYGCARTKTPTFSPRHFASVGTFFEYAGLAVGSLDAGCGRGDVHAVALVVPV